MTEPNCGNCFFFLRVPTAGHPADGLCRRYPPSATAHVYDAGGYRDVEVFTTRPEMREGEWCGEHWPTPTPDADTR